MTYTRRPFTFDRVARIFFTIICIAVALWVINYLRDYFQQFGIAPMIRKICKDLKIDMKKLYELFPTGPAKGACKLAGLSKPTGCV